MRSLRINNGVKTTVCLALVLALCLGVFVYAVIYGEESGRLKAALVYSGSGGSRQYVDTWSQLEQSFAANMDVEKLDVDDGKTGFGKYDIIYLDKSVLGASQVKDELVSFVEDGGALMLLGDFCGYFDPAFLGVREAVDLNAAPAGLVFPEAGEDLGGLQGLISDFAEIYGKYSDYAALSLMDYGRGFVVDTAASLADMNGLSLYGINNYGNGLVFYTNPLLPNCYDINGFSLQKTDERQEHFSNSTATANQLFLSEFASYISKRKFGYSVSRVLGSFAAPDMAWQLHYEEITGIANGSAKLFGELSKASGLIPSYTLIRNTYKWLNKFESVTYLLNRDGYHMDLSQNAYSSGTHVIENGSDYMALNEAIGTGSYFVDNPDFMQMAYPDICDFNGDGVPDIVCGCSDGMFYYFEGEGFDGEWKVKARQTLSGPDGAPLTVGTYSSPALADFDGDGIMDMVSGTASGEVYYFKGGSGFAPGEPLLTVPDIERAMPFAADLNGDGKTDLAIGSLNGVISLYYWDGEGFTAGEIIQCPDETFVAPCVHDYDGDGDGDLIYGTFKGYIARLRNDGGAYTPDGWFETEEMNYEGNGRIKLGANCVPRFRDIDGDGAAALVAGELEYGLAIPIDSPYFRYRNQLQEQIDYIKDNRFYLGVHFYTNQYASPQREAEELRLHKRALDTYAVDYDSVGVNMHTWFMSSFAPDQTIQSAKDAGFLWLSGGQSSKSLAVPQASAESILACPFFTDFENREMMVTNASVLAYAAFGNYGDMGAKYDLPLSEYYHCDLMYQNDAEARSMIEQLAAYKKAHGYNFVREDQLMKSAAAAYNMKLRTRSSGGVLRMSAKGAKKGYLLYDGDYQDCVGVRVELAEKTDPSQVRVEAGVWRYDSGKKALYLGLDREASVSFDGSGSGSPLNGEPHIQSVNIPADVKLRDNGASVRFEDDGMMQVAVTGPAKTESPGWETDFSDGVTTFTRFGGEADLDFVYEY